MSDDLEAMAKRLEDPAFMEFIVKELRGQQEKQKLCGETTNHQNQDVRTKQYLPVQRAFYICNDCGYRGERGLTPGEQQERRRLLNTRVTI